MIRTSAIILLTGVIIFLGMKYNTAKAALDKNLKQDSVIAWCLYEQNTQKPMKCVDRSLDVMDVYEHPNN
jgi:hypothetical protein